MGQLIRDWWEVVAGIATALGWIAASIYRRRRDRRGEIERLERERRQELDRLTHRIDQAEHVHQKHEDLCGQRWNALRDSNDKLERHIEERHKENVDRFNRFEDMLLQLLARKSGKAGN